MGEVPRMIKFIGTEIKMVVARGLRKREKGGLLFNRYSMSVLQDEKMFSR